MRFASKHNTEKRSIMLTESILQSLVYWGNDQVLYVFESNFFKQMIQGMINAYANAKNLRREEIKHFAARVVIALDKIKTSNHKESKDPDYFFCKKLVYDLQTINKRHYKKLKKKKNYSNFRYHVNHFERSISMIIITAPKKFKQLPFISHAKRRMIKICNNHKCKVTKRKNKQQKFKICKKCKITYYCSYKCQKIDWKHYHSKQCHVLTSRLNSVN